MKKLFLLVIIFNSALFINVSNAQLINDIVSFDGSTSPQGANPFGNVIRSGDLLYGMTVEGGANNTGNIFSVDTNGTNYTDIYDFGATSSAEGANAYGSLTFSITGDTLYGMTSEGGLYGQGNIFDILPNGTGYSDLYDFGATSSSEGYPFGSLTLSVTGDTLFGMTYYGGVNFAGNIFAMTTNTMTYTDIYDFTTGNPYGSLTLSITGDTLFGMTSAGGTNGVGNVFSIAENGTGYNDIYDFDGTTGSTPYGSLTLSAKGDTLFGMTQAGGANDMGLVFSVPVTNGSGFADLLDFATGTDSNGANPYGDLTRSGTILYGMTSAGGAGGAGNIFKINTNGSNYKDLANFVSTNGSTPAGDVLLSRGNLYGMAYAGGTNGDGVVFTINPYISLKIIDANVTCNGGNNGSATAVYSGGAQPYTYLWNDASSQTTAEATGLSAGTYTLYVSGPTGLEDSASTVINQPLALGDSAAVVGNVNCHGPNSGSASANPSGGTLPYTYTWTTSPTQTTEVATGLSVGTYSVTISDSCGASVTANVVIKNAVLTNSAAVVANVTCYGGSTGSASANPSGGLAPYTYAWSTSPIQTTEVATGLSAGTYTVAMLDACALSSTGVVVIQQPNILGNFSNVVANVTCYGVSGGAAEANASGGTAPYTYLWTPGGQTSDMAITLSAGSYTVTITDACGAQSTVSAVITQPTALSVTIDSVPVTGNDNGSASVSVSGGTAPYTYLWSPGGQTTTSITGLSAGSYCCQISDANGCEIDSTCTYVPYPAGVNNISNVSGKIDVFPNPNNGNFTVQTSGFSGQAIIAVYDVLGEKVLTENLSNQGLNTINLSSQPGGIYLYRVITETGNLVGEGKLIIQK